jgi:hypothetical protein
MTMRHLAALAFVAATLARGAQAQDQLVTATSAITGVQARGYDIDGLSNTRQIAVPFAIILPVNDRLSVDIGTYYASTKNESVTISGLTDTQIRASYVFGRDALVTTLMVNLPTGETQTLTESSATGAAAANFLAFPVNTYRTGLSVTGGLAYATEVGSWNIGLAGSLRMSGEYQPFSDVDTLDYSPGTEARFKLGVDRAMGSSRLQAGFTFSTFGNDDFTSSGTSTGSYQPGNRYIGELSLSFLSGSGTITGFMWDFFRQEAGGSGPANQENIFSLGASGSWPLGKSMRLEPLVEARFWSPDDGSGRLFGGGAALRIPLGGRMTLSPMARFDFGQMVDTQGDEHNVTGWGASALLRYDI